MVVMTDNMETGKWLEHYRCGGRFQRTGTVVIGWVEVPSYRCEKCNVQVDASDYDQFAAYWEKGVGQHGND